MARVTVPARSADQANYQARLLRQRDSRHNKSSPVQSVHHSIRKARPSGLLSNLSKTIEKLLAPGKVIE